MQRESSSGGVLAVTSLTEYFRDALQGALAHQHLSVEDQTEQYVVNMLTLFARAEHLYEADRPELATTFSIPPEPLMSPLDNRAVHRANNQSSEFLHSLPGTVR